MKYCYPNEDNPTCLNPYHLWQGTHEQNLIDASKKDQKKQGIQ